jgi:hypothetical protein
MPRSTNTQKPLNLNAAHDLLSRGITVAEAATILARERSISLRQAYWSAHVLSVVRCRLANHRCRQRSRYLATSLHDCAPILPAAV